MEASTTQGSALTLDQIISEEFRSLPTDARRLAEIRHTLDTVGFIGIEDFLTPDGHALLRQQILDLESAATASMEGQNRKFAIKGDALRPTVVGQLAGSAYILDLVNNLLGSLDGRPAYVDEPIRQEEVIAGINIMRTQSDVTAFHFDGTYMNLILPVILPNISGPRRGQLIIFPNMRSFGRGLWQKGVIGAIARVPALRKLWTSHELDYKERGVYIFYGYRSLHGVESQSEAALRCITNMTIGATRFR